MVKYYENERERGLIFKNGIDPQVLIDAIHEIDVVESPKDFRFREDDI